MGQGSSQCVSPAQVLGHHCRGEGQCAAAASPVNPSTLAPASRHLAEAPGLHVLRGSPHQNGKWVREGEQFQGCMSQCNPSWKEEYPDSPLFLLRRPREGGGPARPSWESWEEAKRSTGSPRGPLLGKHPVPPGSDSTGLLPPPYSTLSPQEVIKM